MESPISNNSSLGYTDLAGFAVNFPLVPMFGAVASGGNLCDEGLGLDVIGQMPHDVGDTGRRFEVDADAVRDFQAGIFAHVLDAVDELAGETFVDQFGSERRVES